MVNVILEIAKKEIFSYYNRKAMLLQNFILLLVFCYVPISQMHQAIAEGGYTSSSLTAALDMFLLIATFSPVIIASGISILAFPVERDLKTMEYLLSLPLTDGEIFLGKSLASIATGLAAAVLVFSIIIGVTIFTSDHPIIWDAPLLTPSLAILMFGIVPAIIVLSTLAVVALSSLVTSSRSAYILNMVLMGVMIGLGTAKLALPVDAALYDLGMLALSVILIVVAYLIGVRFFNRENLIAKA